MGRSFCHQTPIFPSFYSIVKGRRPANFTLSSASYAGGAGGTRTPDFRLAKAALSQLSYGPTAFRAWWAMVDSNHRPRSYQDRALTS